MTQTRRAPTYAEINQLFLRLDRDPALAQCRFDGWLAWPIVKERVWLRVSGTGSEASSRRRARSPLAGFFVLAGCFEILLNIALPGRHELALLYHPRSLRLPDGSALHPQLGRLPEGHGAAPPFRYIYERDRRPVALPVRGCIQERATGAFVAAAARLLRRTRRISRAASHIAERVAAHTDTVGLDELRSICADQLARFLLKRRILRIILSRNRVRAVVVLDAFSKGGEIAAGRDLGLGVFEMQHGMFGSGDPDYSWTAADRSKSALMPLPDRIFVFGPLWRDALLRNGFRGAGDVIEVGNAGLIALRRARHKAAAGWPLRVLFPTQASVRHEALAFWREVLARSGGAGEASLRLQIVVHPREAEHHDAYAELARLFPDRCTVAPPGFDGLQGLIDADLVAGYSSMMLLEAVGLGIPTVSLRGELMPEGFAAAFGMPALREVMPHLSSAAEFLALLQACRSASHYEQWCARTVQAAAAIYAFPPEGVDARILRAVADKATDQPVPAEPLQRAERSD